MILIPFRSYYVNVVSYYTATNIGLLIPRVIIFVVSNSCLAVLLRWLAYRGMKYDSWKTKSMSYTYTDIGKTCAQTLMVRVGILGIRYGLHQVTAKYVDVINFLCTTIIMLV